MKFAGSPVLIINYPVLHPAYKLQYFRDQDWPAEWINEAVDIIRTEWIHNYKPDGPPEPAAPVPEPTPGPSTGSKGKERMSTGGSSTSKGKERAGTSGRRSAAAASGQVRHKVCITSYGT